MNRNQPIDQRRREEAAIRNRTLEFVHHAFLAPSEPLGVRTTESWSIGRSIYVRVFYGNHAYRVKVEEEL